MGMSSLFPRNEVSNISAKATSEATPTLGLPFDPKLLGQLKNFLPGTKFDPIFFFYFIFFFHFTKFLQVVPIM